MHLFQSVHLVILGTSREITLPRSGRKSQRSVTMTPGQRCRGQEKKINHEDTSGYSRDGNGISQCIMGESQRLREGTGVEVRHTAQGQSQTNSFQRAEFREVPSCCTLRPFVHLQKHSFRGQFHRDPAEKVSLSQGLMDGHKIREHRSGLAI